MGAVQLMPWTSAVSMPSSWAPRAGVVVVGAVASRGGSGPGGGAGAGGAGVTQRRPLWARTPTALVTFGIGGNDIGFSELITQCATSGILYFVTGSGEYTGNHAPCRGQYVDGTTDTVRHKINTVGDRLADTLAEVRRRLPPPGAAAAQHHPAATRRRGPEVKGPEAEGA